MRFTVIAIGLVICALAAYALTTRAVAIAAIVVAPGLLALAWVFWRQAVYVMLMLVFVEGIVRILVDQPAVLLAKDVVVAILLVRTIYERRKRGLGLVPHHPANLALAILAGIALAEMVNPAQTTPLVGLIGLRTWLFYAALLYVSREAITSEGGLKRITNFYVLAGIPLGAVAIVQYVLGPVAYIQLGAAFGRAAFVTTTGNSLVSVYRPNSTFAWPSHFAIYLGAATLFCAALALQAGGLGRWGYGVLLILFVVGDVIENQRTLLVLLPFLIAFVFSLGRRRAWIPAAALFVAGVVGLTILQHIGGGQIGAVQRLVEMAADPGGQIGGHTDTFIGQTLETLRQAPFGLGTGATSIGSRYVATDVPLFVESSLAKAGGDMGLAGIVSYVALFATLIYAAVRTALRDAGATGRIAAATAGFEVLLFLGGYDLAIGAITLWLFSGAIAFGDASPEPKSRPVEVATPGPRDLRIPA